MYCSSCGVEVTQELNYCNRCGANLSPAVNLVPQPPAPVKLTGPTIGVAAMVVLSLIVILGFVDNLALRGVHPTAIAWIAIIAIGMVFGVAALIINLFVKLLLSGRTAAAAAEQRPPQLKKQHSNPQLSAPQTGPMNPPVSSVTDHTTRTFEPAHRERFEREKRS